MLIIYWLIVFTLGFILGYLLKALLISFKEYSGTIVVNQDEFSDKKVYTLVLDEYPEKLEFKKVVKFKVDTSDESSQSQAKH